jgi:hypothetical protein
MSWSFCFFFQSGWHYTCAIPAASTVLSFLALDKCFSKSTVQRVPVNLRQCYSDSRSAKSPMFFCSLAPGHVYMMVLRWSMTFGCVICFLLVAHPGEVSKVDQQYGGQVKAFCGVGERSHNHKNVLATAPRSQMCFAWLLWYLQFCF